MAPKLRDTISGAMYPIVPRRALAGTKLVSLGYNLARPKSATLGTKIAVKKNVVWLDVKVKDLHIATSMQVVDAPSNA